MTQDLQHLLEKINADGVEKAQSEAARIIGQANDQARATLDAARQAADELVANAKQAAEAFERRAEETIRQSARDTVLHVEKAITDLLTALLVKDVNAAMSNPDLVASLAAESVRTYLSQKSGKGGIDVVGLSKLSDALRATLAAEAAHGVRVVTDDHAGTGFKVRLAGGRIEHDFTGTAVADALAKQLRPGLAALLH